MVVGGFNRLMSSTMRSFLIARVLSISPHSNTSEFQLGSLLPRERRAFLCFNSFTSRSFSDSKSERNHLKDDAFTVSYLIDSCGLSPELAKKLSKRVNLKNPDGPDAVLALLNKYGFSKIQLSMFVKRLPLVLLANPENTLLPKLQFFHSVGVSTTDVPKILIRNASLLFSSLGNCLIPRYKVLRSVLRDEEEAVAALRINPRSFTFSDIIHNLVPNVKVLRQFGVPQDSISYLVCNHPGAAYMKHSKFVEAAKKAKEMGFDPLAMSFVVAVKVLAKMNKGMFESKLEVYHRWGWSRNISLLAFKKYPYCGMMSDDKIMKTMSFLVKGLALRTYCYNSRGSKPQLGEDNYSKMHCC